MNIVKEYVSAYPWLFHIFIYTHNYKKWNWWTSNINTKQLLSQAKGQVYITV